MRNCWCLLLKSQMVARCARLVHMRFIVAEIVALLVHACTTSAGFVVALKGWLWTASCREYVRASVNLRWTRHLQRWRAPGGSYAVGLAELLNISSWACPSVGRKGVPERELPRRVGDVKQPRLNACR
eukprot:5535761-Amphidinium_carterae.1